MPASTWTSVSHTGQRMSVVVGTASASASAAISAGYLTEVEGRRAAVEADVTRLRHPVVQVGTARVELDLGEKGAIKAASAPARAHKQHRVKRTALRGATGKPSTDLRRPCGPSPGSAPALLAHA